MPFNLASLFSKKVKATTTGQPTSFTNTYNPAATTSIKPLSTAQEHLSNLYDNRLSSDSRALIQDMARSDPDVSAAFNAYLTVANQPVTFYVRDVNGELDSDGHLLLMQMFSNMFMQLDYTQGFQLKQSLYQTLADWRYMLMLRGGIAAELVFGKQMMPDSIQLIDTNTLRWTEPTSGVYKPQQLPASFATPLPLDFPTIFCSWYRRDPTAIANNSPFVSSINTISARQLVINDLYRIMNATGFPRLDVTALEEVVMKNAPSDIAADPAKLRPWMNARLGEINNAFSGLRPEQAFIHWDSVQAKIINEKNAGAGIDISKIIETLNAQNQAALKVVAPVLGRGNASVNTASVEARIFSLNADELNYPLAEMLSGITTMMLNSQGRANIVEARFKSAELRPELELEPQKTMLAARLKQDLSLGIITDDEYTLALYGRFPNAGATPLSGTGFMPIQGATVNTDNITPNADPLGQSLVPQGSGGAKSNGVK